MSSRNRSLASPSSSSTVKRPSITGNQSKKIGAAKTQFTKKRVALGDITNQGKGFQSVSRALVTQSKPMDTYTSPKTPSSESFDETMSTRDSLECMESLDEIISSLECLENVESFDETMSTRDSLECLESFDEIMSAFKSLESPKFEYLENEDVSASKSIETKANNNLYISNYTQKEGKISIAHVIYNNSRASEATKRPSTDYMEMVQKDINADMRAIVIDWLVKVTEEYMLLPETLFLTVNYIDRYLSSNSINRQQLQLLGLACMLIASKYEETTKPKVEVFCNVTDNTYRKDEMLQMESAVLNYLKFEMTVPTANFFLRQFVCAAEMINQDHPLQFECLANYIAKLSLFEYTMIHYAPSLIAASAAFLARFILSSSEKPWDSILRDYALYQPSDLRDCVKALHHLYSNGGSANLPAIKEKYSQFKYFSVARRDCPASIPEEFFQDV